MHDTDAASTLRQVEALRSSTRVRLRRLDSLWFALIVWGAISLASAPVAAWAPGIATPLFWLAATIAGVVVTAKHYRRIEVEVGLGDRTLPWLALTVLLVCGAFAFGIFGGRAWREVGPWVVVAIAYLGFARLGRSAAVAILALGLGLLALSLGVADVAHAGALCGAAFGVSWVALGLTMRAREG